MGPAVSSLAAKECTYRLVSTREAKGTCTFTSKNALVGCTNVAKGTKNLAPGSTFSARPRPFAAPVSFRVDSTCKSIGNTGSSGAAASLPTIVNGRARGSWDGNPITVQALNISAQGKVSGQIVDADGSITASMQGTRRPDGTLDVTLSYRFEEFGTFVLKPSGSQRWQSAKLSFAL
jgi:hypothetical protein